MFPRSIAIVCALALSACASDTQECNADSACGSGFRCEKVEAGEAKICVACDAEETRYDGVDNDCNRRTRDSDLDDDGDNWKDAAVAPGGDCDDNDSLVSSKLSEVCSDTKDNDCDGRTDELDCGDVLPPSVTVHSPMRGAFVSGGIVFEIDASDDSGLQTIRLLSREPNGEIERASQAFGGAKTADVSFPIDTRGFADGPISFVVEATDVAERVDREIIDLNIDNVSPPTITIVRPTLNATHGGLLTIAAGARDAARVASVEIFLDSVSVRSVTGTTAELYAEHVVDTSTLADGSHRISVASVDDGGHSASVEVAFFVDNTAPTVSITAPAQNTVVQNDARITVRGEDNLSVSRLVLGSQNIQPNVGSITHTFTVDSTNYPNGPLTLTAEAQDGAILDDLAGPGNIARTTLRLIVDNMRPEPQILIQPADGSYVMGVTRILVEVSSDVGADISTLTIRVDGEELAYFAPPDLFEEISRYYDFGFAPGSHRIEVTATDSLNQSSTAISDIVAISPPMFGLPRLIREELQRFDPATLGDFNGDGILDAMGSNTDDSLILYEGKIYPWGWSLGRSTALPLQANGAVPRVIDMNSDGIDDILVVQNYDAAVFDFSTTPPTRIDSPMVYASGAHDVGDVDNDGDVDVVVLWAAAGNDFAVYENNAGVFTLGPRYGQGSSSFDGIHAVDLEDDDDVDVVVCGQSLRAYLNDGTGAFGAAIESNASENLGASNCEVSDVTGDGVLDVVVASSVGYGIVTMGGSPNIAGVFQEVATSTTVTARLLALSDLNGDALPDIITNYGAGRTLNIGINQGNGVFLGDLQDRIVLAEETYELAARDVDGDNDDDVLVTGYSFPFPYGGAPLYVIENHGGGVFGGAKSTRLPLGVFGDPAFPSGIAVGDFFGSATPDIAFVGSGTGLVIFESSGDNFTPTLTIDDVEGDGLFAANLDGQGKLDLALRNYTVRGLINQNGSFFTTPSFSFADSIAISDVNSDGVDDIVYAGTNGPSEEYGVLRYDALMQSFTHLDQVPSSGAPRLVTAGDLGNDAASDYVVVDQVLPDLLVRSWNGSGLTPSTVAAVPGMRNVAIGHDALDGVADIFVLNNSGIQRLDGLPAGGFAAPQQVMDVVYAPMLTLDDFNGDGVADMLLGEEIFVGSPTGGFFDLPLRIPTGNSGVGTYTGDFDGDGRLDLVTSFERLMFLRNETP